MAGPFICDGGQASLERLGIVTGDLVVQPGAGQSKDVNGGGRGMLPAWALGGQCLGLAGAVTGRHHPDQEAGRVDEPRTRRHPNAGRRELLEPGLVPKHQRRPVAGQGVGGHWNLAPTACQNFLGLEHDGEFDLLGQDELGPSPLENAFEDQFAKAAAKGTWTEQQTERILLAAARVGQHVFALNVLANCGGRCVFCGLNPGSFGAKRMLVAGHIKPWKDSTSTERLDLRNGLAACPSHDVAFDTGLLTVDVSLQVHVSGALADAVRADPLARQYYGRPPLRDTILLPDQAQPPGHKYLDWHKANVFAA